MPDEPSHHPEPIDVPAAGPSEPEPGPTTQTSPPTTGGGGRRLVVLGVAVLLVALVAGGVWWQSSRSSPADEPVATAELAGEVRDVGVAFGTGPKLVEIFVDYQCPHCSDLEAVIGTELKTMLDADEIEVVVRPVKFLSRASGRGAAALYCATPGDQGLAMHDAMLADIAQDFSPEGLTTVAGTLGLDETTFGACMTDRATTTWVNDVTDAAREEGLTSIPVVFVDGTRLSDTDTDAAAAFREAVLGSTT